MTGTQDIFEWIAVLFIVCAGFLLAIRIRDWWHTRNNPPIPRPEEVVNTDHRYSLRRGK